MIIETFVLGTLEENCYLLYDREKGSCAVVDPGSRPGRLIRRIEELSLNLTAVLLTHGHFDHILGLDMLLEQSFCADDCVVYALAKEEALLTSASKNLSGMFGSAYIYEDATYVEDGQMLSVIGEEIQVIATPGHTVGGCCYYVAAEKALFTGDTLFRGSVGRSDFPTGDESTLFSSIREKLLILPDEVTVYPGHMQTTTIGREKEVFL